MKAQTKFILIGVAAIAATTTVAVIITRARKKRAIAEIITKIQGGVGQFGNYNDIPTMNAFNPAFWRKSEFKNGQTYDFNKAINLAKTMHGYIVRNDAELAYTMITAMVSQQQISEVSEAYKTTYGSNMGLDMLDNLSSKWLDKIYNYINLLPQSKPLK